MKKRQKVQRKGLFEATVPEERLFNTLPQVKRVGFAFISGGKVMNFDVNQKFEFCFRIFSETEELACDIVNGKQYQYAFTHLLIKIPGSHLKTYIDGRRQTYYVLYPPETFDWFDRAGLISDEPLIEFTMTPEINGLFNEFRQSYKQLGSPGAADRLDQVCMQLIMAVVSQKKQEFEKNKSVSAVKAIAEIIKEFPLREHDLPRLAGEHGISNRNFFRCWKKVFGETPGIYIRNRRLEVAAELLKKSRKSISEIAKACGFSTVSYFSKIFKEKYGITPGTYRK